MPIIRLLEDTVLTTSFNPSAATGPAKARFQPPEGNGDPEEEEEEYLWGQVSVCSSGASHVAVPTQLQQREDPAQKGGRLGRNSGSPARGTSYDHQQSQAGRKKGRTIHGEKEGAIRDDGTPIRQQPATCPARTEQANPRARHFWFSDDSGAAEMRRQVTSWASGIIGRSKPVQVDPGPSPGPPACLPKCSGSRWLCGCQIPKEKGLGMGDSILRGPAVASPRPGELNTA